MCLAGYANVNVKTKLNYPITFLKAAQQKLHAAQETSNVKPPLNPTTSLIKTTNFHNKTNDQIQAQK